MNTKETIKIDAKNEILGRLAVRVANLLRGKDKADFVPHQDRGARVEVFNTDLIKLTGKKILQKEYKWHSGYPGGLKKKKVSRQLSEDSREVLRRAVLGMLPKNKLQKVFINKLKLHKQEIKDQ